MKPSGQLEEKVVVSILENTTQHGAIKGKTATEIVYESADKDKEHMGLTTWKNSPDGPNEKGMDEPRSFDAMVANPPYSVKWDNRASKLKDPRFNKFGKLAPDSKADYAFVLHSIYYLNSKGTMAIVLPHCVLFRGAAEKQIRQKLIEENWLDAVIGLPANLFYGTSIPTIDLAEVQRQIAKDNAEIAELEKEIQEQLKILGVKM